MNKKNQKISDANTYIQESINTIIQIANDISSDFKKANEAIKGQEFILEVQKFSENIKKSADILGTIDLSGVVAYHAEKISSMAKLLQDVYKQEGKEGKINEEIVKTRRKILEKQLNKFYSAIGSSFEYVPDELKKRIIKSKVAEKTEESLRNISNSFLDLAEKTGFKKDIFTPFALRIEKGKMDQAGFWEKIFGGALQGFGKALTESVSFLKNIFNIVGPISKFSIVASGIFSSIKTLFDFFEFKLKAQSIVRTIGMLNLAGTSDRFSFLNQQFNNFFNNLGSFGIGMQKYFMEFLETINSTNRFLLSSKELTSRTNQFIKAMFLGRAYNIDPKESLDFFTKLFFYIGKAGENANKTYYDFYKNILRLSAIARTNLNEFSDIVGNIFDKILIYGAQTSEKYFKYITTIINKFGKDLEVGKAFAKGISSFLEKDLTYQVGLIAKFGNLNSLMNRRTDFVTASFQALSNFLKNVRANLTQSPFGRLAFANILSNFLGPTVGRMYFTRYEEIGKDLEKVLLEKEFFNIDKVQEIMKKIEGIDETKQAIKVLTEQKAILERIFSILEDIKFKVFYFIDKIISYLFGGIVRKFKGFKLIK